MTKKGRCIMRSFGDNGLIFGMAVLFLISFGVSLPLWAQQQMGPPPQESNRLGLAEPGLPAKCMEAGYLQDGGEKIIKDKTYSSTKEGIVESSVCVKNGGWLTLMNAKITKTGDKDEGVYAGQAVEASEGSVINLLEPVIYTETSGANGIWATNEGSMVYMKGGSITTLEGSAHGVDVTRRGSVILYDVDIDTSGQSASGALVNDSGDGTIYARKVRAKTKGPGSSGFYMIGSMSMLTLRDSSLDIEKSEVGVLVHGSIVTITDTNMKGGKGGIKVSGGTLNISGGSLTVTDGDAFYIGGGEGGIPSGEGSGRGGGMPGGMPEGGMPGEMPQGGMPEGGMPGGAMMGGGLMPFYEDTNNTINIEDGTKISASTGVLINHADDCKCTFSVNGTDLEGDIIVAAEEGDLTVSLNDSILTSKIEGAALSLANNSTWNVTGDSVVTSLSNAGISGVNITNINGNGYTVVYDRDLNEGLGGRTYSLKGGGTLKPAM